MLQRFCGVTPSSHICNGVDVQCANSVCHVVVLMEQALVEYKQARVWLVVNGRADSAAVALAARHVMTVSRVVQCTSWKLELRKRQCHAVQAVSSILACFGQVEEHMVDGKMKQLLVHRKGSTRAFPPHHPLIPVDYQLTGQPVLIGGTMGTNSYVLTGANCLPSL